MFISLEPLNKLNAFARRLKVFLRYGTTVAKHFFLRQKMQRSANTGFSTRLFKRRRDCLRVSKWRGFAVSDTPKDCEFKLILSDLHPNIPTNFSNR